MIKSNTIKGAIAAAVLLLPLASCQLGPTARCREIPLPPDSGWDYTAHAGGYGTWTFQHDVSTETIGFALEEDAKIYPDLELAMTCPEY